MRDRHRRLREVANRVAVLYARSRDMLLGAIPEPHATAFREAADRAEFPEFHLLDPVQVALRELEAAGVDSDKLHFAQQAAATFEREKSRLTYRLRSLSRAREAGAENAEDFEATWNDYWTITVRYCRTLRDLFTAEEMEALPAPAELALAVW